MTGTALSTHKNHAINHQATPNNRPPFFLQTLCGKTGSSLYMLPGKYAERAVFFASPGDPITCKTCKRIMEKRK